MNKANVRLPAVAGMFYPDDPAELKRNITSYLQDAEPPGSKGPPRAMIAPHAGYVYSGPVAGSAYATIAPLKNTVSRVIILGPSHRVGFQGIACSGASSFRTPLGDVPVDIDAQSAVSSLPFVMTYDAAHHQEHGIEVHLPFLQHTLSQFAIVPLVVGNAAPDQVASIIDLLWGGSETLVVVSSDLSHYLPYEDAKKIDRTTTRAIEQLNPEAIDSNHACGWLPVNGLLIEAVRHGLEAETVDLRNSGDTAGSKDQVVGYGAYVFS